LLESDLLELASLDEPSLDDFDDELDSELDPLSEEVDEEVEDFFDP